VIEGLLFGALQNNTGSVIYNDTTAAHFEVRNCLLGFDSKSQGILLEIIADSQVDVVGGRFQPWVAQAIRTNTAGASLGVNGVRFQLPASAYSSAVIALGGLGNSRTRIVGCEFDGRAITAGAAPAAISITGGYLTFGENIFRGSSFALLTGLNAGTGNAVISEGHNTYEDSTTIPYGAGSVALANGSSLSVPRKLLRVAGAGTSVTWPDDVETLEVEGTSTLPTIVMPANLYTGRRARLVIKNATGSPWGGPVVFSPVLPIVPIFAVSAPSALPAGQTMAYDFEVTTSYGPQIWTVMSYTH
jgi:hypothetical protein